MGGVDRGDQNRGYYQVRLKSRKMYKCIFWFLFDVTIINAFILKQFAPARGRKHLPLKDFRVQLAKELIGDYCSRKQLGRQGFSHRQAHLRNDSSPSTSHARQQKDTAGCATPTTPHGTVLSVGCASATLAQTVTALWATIWTTSCTDSVVIRLHLYAIYSSSPHHTKYTIIFHGQKGLTLLTPAHLATSFHDSSSLVLHRRQAGR